MHPYELTLLQGLFCDNIKVNHIGLVLIVLYLTLMYRPRDKYK